MESKNIAADFMETLYGRPWAVAFTWLILWTALASVFALTLGYSRIPFAATRQGDFFAAFGALHPTGKYPWVSLLALGVLTAVFCFLELSTVINAAVCVRIVVQFLGQIAALCAASEASDMSSTRKLSGVLSPGKRMRTVSAAV